MDAQSQGTGTGNNQSGKPTLTWTQPQKPAGAPGGTPKSTPSAPKTPAKNGATNSGAYVGTFVGGLIVGVLLGWGITGLHGNSMGADTQGMTATTSTSTTAAAGTGTTSMNLSGAEIGSGNLVINSPQAAGLTVSVAKVVVSQPTWVVIYEDHGGSLGNALGAALFTPVAQGGSTSGTVDLLRGTTPGETYLVGEALDDGDHQFSLQTDMPVRDANGNPILGQFQTN